MHPLWLHLFDFSAALNKERSFFNVTVDLLKYRVNEK